MGGGRDWACGALDGIAPGEGGGVRGAIEQPASPAANPRSSIRQDDRAGLVRVSGRRFFSKDSQPRLKSRASALGKISKFTGVLKGFAGQGCTWLSGQQFTGQRP